MNIFKCVLFATRIGYISGGLCQTTSIPKVLQKAANFKAGVIPPILILLPTALAATGQASLCGYHGLSQILYQFTTSSANNGSGFQWLKDTTPEGKSTVELGQKLGFEIDEKEYAEDEFLEFTAQTKSSGMNRNNGEKIRKGAASSIMKFVQNNGGNIPSDLKEKVDRISKLGGTPLVVAKDDKIYGVIYLKDTVKPGLAERFVKLREMGIKTIMCTGDNPLTAATIEKEAGVDEYIAECTPEDKIEAIKREHEMEKIVAMTGDGTNDAAKYFAIITAMFMIAIPEMQILNVMRLSSSK